MFLSLSRDALRTFFTEIDSQGTNALCATKRQENDFRIGNETGSSGEIQLSRTCREDMKRGNFESNSAMRGNLWLDFSRAPKRPRRHLCLDIKGPEVEDEMEPITYLKKQDRFHSGIFDVKVAPHTGRPVMENVDKITEIIVDRHVSRRSIAQELKIDYKTVLNLLRKVGFKKNLDVWVPHQLTPKNMMGRISICEALAKWNEIDPFLKGMVSGDEKWVAYYNFVRKRSWSKCGEAAQTVAKPGLSARKVLLRIWWDWKGIIY
ncbi:histone-lysine N-methyltransferase SETMAR [Trichonephila clavipes]|nr:histone-lysine N-methyltransferase SETMAR [Trichonephila clavipes]